MFLVAERSFSCKGLKMVIGLCFRVFEGRSHPVVRSIKRRHD